MDKDEKIRRLQLRLKGQTALARKRLEALKRQEQRVKELKQIIEWENLPQ